MENKEKSFMDYVKKFFTNEITPQAPEKKEGDQPKSQPEKFAEQLKKGDAINLENGTYTVVAKDGLIDTIEKIKDPESGDGSTPPAPDRNNGVGEQTNESNPANPPGGHGGFSKEEFEKQFKELSEKFSSIEKENAQLKSKVEELGKQSSAKPLDVKDTQSPSKNTSDYSALRKYFKTEKDFLTFQKSQKAKEIE